MLEIRATVPELRNDAESVSACGAIGPWFEPPLTLIHPAYAPTFSGYHNIGIIPIKV